MGRRKREPMSEVKRNIIGMLIEEYDIKSANVHCNGIYRPLALHRRTRNNRSGTVEA